MALNLWKIGGKPTSYNPLPTGWTEVSISGYKSYTMTFRAKSASSASITLYARMGNELVKTINLTPVLTTYSASVDVITSNLFSIFNSNSTDIIIDSIELVQKPLPKLTLNGVDGFTSGKWTLHANAVVVNDETLVLNATAGSQESYVDIPVIYGQTYSFSIGETNGSIFASYMDSSKNWLSNYNGGGTLNNGTSIIMNVINVAYFRIRLGSYLGGTFTFKRLMLNLGSTPAPYSRKTGDKMVLPVARKNLFDGALEIGGIDWTTATNYSSSVNMRSTNCIPVIGGKTYTLSSNVVISGYDVLCYDVAKTRVTGLNTLPFTVPSNVAYIRFMAKTITDLTAKIQLEEGMLATAYTPYDVQGNKKAKKYVPKKNLFDPDYFVTNTIANGATTTRVGNGVKLKATVAGSWRQSRCTFNLKPNTQYSMSFANTVISGAASWDVKNSADAYITVTGSTFTTDTQGVAKIGLFCTTGTSSIGEVDYTDIILVEGSAATSYEPYALVTPKARTGLVFNGVSDYLQLPSMTMDSVEIDCLIDSANVNNNYVIDARSGLTNGYFYVAGTGAFIKGSDFTIYVDGVSTTNVTKGQRTKIKAVANSSFTDNVNIFSASSGSAVTKGTLYKVTCYLNNQVVAQYDFENASNIVGSTVLQGANNLISNFDDARWSLHVNTQILGKHLLRLNATGMGQRSTYTLNVIPNMTYLLTCNKTINGVIEMHRSDNGVQFSALNSTSTSSTFTVPSDCTSIELRVLNYVATGTFDFSKPQLYALSGAEGTLNGTPTSARKQSRRTQYAKR